MRSLFARSTRPRVADFPSHNPHLRPEEMPTKRFRIAFSFAGEKRDFVDAVARLLAEQFGESAILYDKFHEAEFARHDLGLYLPKLYGEQSDLVIPVLCPRYDAKRWTGWEWLHIYGLLTKADGRHVMPCRFEHAEADGLSPAAGFIELDAKSPEDFSTLILQRLALNEGHPRDHYARPAPPGGAPFSTSTPNNLPRLQPFFGRESELAQVRDALDPENRTWGALIDGPGGMGKTSLAIRAAYDCPPGQFGRIVFLSVKNRELEDDGIRYRRDFLLPGFLEMLNELARELDQPDILKAPEDQRVRLLHAALRPAQALLILDNLESLTKDDRDRLFDFVKRLPQGCKAILTSRRRIGSGSELLILERLDQDAALATLADLARHNKLLAKTTEEERIALYEQTAGNPLLLRWVAGQLGRGNCRTLDDALNFLRTCPPENDPLEFVFGDLVNEFTEAETRALCALTYFTMPASLEHIRALINPLSERYRARDETTTLFIGSIGGPAPSAADAELRGTLAEAEIGAALGSLANRSLVVPDYEEKAYTLVPMVAEFLRRRKPEVIAEAGDRLEKLAYVSAIENGYKRYDRFATLADSWPAIAGALQRFLAGPNDRLQEVRVALSHFLDITGRWDEHLSLSRDAEAKAVAAGDFWNAGWCAYSGGWIGYLRGQSSEVLAGADRSYAHWTEAHAGPRERAGAIRLRGIGHRLAGDYPAAIAAFREAVGFWRDFRPDGIDVAVGLISLGEAERFAGDLDAAEDNYREGLRIAQTLDDREAIANCTSNLAALALAREEWSVAESLARKALSLSEKISYQAMIAETCSRLAQSLARQDRGPEARPHARRAVEIYTALRSPDLEAARRTLAECEG